jgi:hypothetical protein
LPLESGGCHENQNRIHHIEQGAKDVVEGGRWIVELDNARKDQGEVVGQQEAGDEVQCQLGLVRNFLLFFREIKTYQLKPEDPKYCL